MKRFRANHLTSASESIVDVISHGIRERWHARKERKKLANLHGYFDLMQEFRADVPVTLCDDITPIPEAPTVEHAAVNLEARDWPQEQLARMILSKLPTRPLPEVQMPIHRRETLPLPAVRTEQYDSIKPEILGKVKTKPLGDPGFRALRPAFSTQASLDKRNGLISRNRRGA